MRALPSLAIPSPLGRAGFAVVIVTAVTMTKLAIGGFAAADEDAFFLAGIGIVAWFAGARAGAFAVLLSAMAQAYFFIPPEGSLAIETPAKALALGVWFVEGNLLCLLFGALWRARIAAIAIGIDAQRSEHVMRQLFEAAPTPMLAMDRATGRFLAVNDAAASLYGYSREDLLTLSLNGMRADPLPASEATSVTSGTARHVRSDGSFLTLEVLASPAQLDGNAVSILAMRVARAA